MRFVRTGTVGLLLGVLALAGCAAGEKGPGVATAGGRSAGASPTPVADQEERARQFADCMRDHGVEVSDPDGTTGLKGAIADAPDVDKQTMLRATEACRQYLPDGGQPQRPTAEQLEKLRRHAQCMRENGVPDWPDPDPDGNTRMGSAGPDKDSSDVREALEKCLPEGGRKG